MFHALTCKKISFLFYDKSLRKKLEIYQILLFLSSKRVLIFYQKCNFYLFYLLLGMLFFFFWIVLGGKFSCNLLLDLTHHRVLLKMTYINIYLYCRFPYAGNWELVKSIVGTKFRRRHVCLHSQAGNRLWLVMALIFSVMLWQLLSKNW